MRIEGYALLCIHFSACTLYHAQSAGQSNLPVRLMLKEQVSSQPHNGTVKNGELNKSHEQLLATKSVMKDIQR